MRTEFVPRRFESIAFGFLLSGFMSFLVSGLTTALAIGAGADFPSIWITSWISSWAVAFPSVLIVAPIVRKILGLIVKSSAEEDASD